MHYPIPRALARFLAVGVCAVGIPAAVASSAQAAPQSKADACADARDGVAASSGGTVTDFSGKSTWLNQATFIFAGRGRTNPDAQGANNLEGLAYYTNRTDNGDNTGSLNCRVIYSARNGFLKIDHVDIWGGINYYWNSVDGYVPTVFWTSARNCYSDYPSANTQFSCPL